MASKIVSKENDEPKNPTWVRFNPKSFWIKGRNKTRAEENPSDPA